MRLLVTGEQGQLARALKSIDSADTLVVAAGRPGLDISDRKSIEAAILHVRPDIVINAAAYTAVDKAEDDREQAFLINENGARNVAAAAAAAGLPIVHISTDYVFPGSSPRPYVETDACVPLGVYGESKLAGERAVETANPDHLILRTAWVFSEHGANFLKTMLRLATMQDSVRVVADQIGTPTYAGDLAKAIAAACGQIVSGGGGVWQGIYHVVPCGQTSWAGFAEEIFRLSALRGGPSAGVVPITTEEYPTRALRPHYSVLNPSLFESRFCAQLPPWQDATERCLNAMAPARNR